MSGFEPDIPFLDATWSLRKTHCLSRRHIVSLEDIPFSGGHIVSPESTLSLPKKHCLSRSGTLSLLRPCSPPRSKSSQQAIERASDRASDRASERQASDERQSLLRRKTCALLRAKTSTLLRRKTCVVLTARTCALFKANTKGRPSAATTKVAARPSAARPPLWCPLYSL